MCIFPALTCCMGSRLFPACLLSSSMHTTGLDLTVLGSPLSVLDADNVRPCPWIWTTSWRLEAVLVASRLPQSHGCLYKAQSWCWPSTEPHEAGAQHPAILRKHSSKAHFLPPSLEHIPTYWPHTLTELSSTANTGLSLWPAACPILLRDAVGWQMQPTGRSLGGCQTACGLLRPWPKCITWVCVV